MTSHRWSLVALLIAIGCYNPKFDDGLLLCSAASECPAGYQCGSDKACYKTGAAPLIKADAGHLPGDAGTVSDPDGGVAACTDPTPGCVAPKDLGGKCDPVCQSGCKCREKCFYEGATPTCGPAKLPVKNAGEVCDTASDTCRPGAVCLEELRTECGAHCYHYCRVDADCGDKARCIGAVTASDGSTVYKICSPLIEALCLPFGKADCPGAGRSLPTFGCYVLSALHPDLSVCDCAGTKPAGSVCANEHECVPGTECIKLGAQATCRKICTLNGVVAGPCPSGTTCTPFAPGGVNSIRYGYCK